MALNFTANQFDDAFLPRKLCNWETPRGRGKVHEDEVRPGTLKPRKKTTDFIVDERGHLLPTVKKLNNSFNTRPRVYELSSPRWPKNPLVTTTPRATMGYKGIQTTYLPSSTVPLNSVVIPGIAERHYE